MDERAPNVSTNAPPSASSNAPVAAHPLVKLAVEAGPLAVFFLMNSYRDIFWGTAAFMVATVAALVASRALFGRLPVMPLVSGVFVLIFGSLTLWLGDDLFIKMKPTLVNFLFAAILFGGLIYGQPLLKYLFGEVFQLNETGWRVLTFRWACFFCVLAILNEIVWRSFSTETWLSFKLFGIMPLTMAFAIAQIGVLKRYELPSETQRNAAQ
jgi:intracellular septation protein